MTVVTRSLTDELTDEELTALSADLETAGPEAILRWALAEFGTNVALATGFGMEGCVLVSMLADIDKRARLFYLDTDLLFPETYALRDQLEERYQIRFERRATNLSLPEQAELYGERLWERSPDQCCRLRKVMPLKAMLSALQAWITGIRRDQSPTRAMSRCVERDTQFDLIKINPLVGWSAQDVWRYLKDNEVPYNALHDAGYRSIGCTPCTTPIQIGEDPRAGRWRGTGKTECGIHQPAR
jgi:phosphoadenosine phosphosulfate reductase